MAVNDVEFLCLCQHATLKNLGEGSGLDYVILQSHGLGLDDGGERGTFF